MLWAWAARLGKGLFGNESHQWIEWGVVENISRVESASLCNSSERIIVESLTLNHIAVWNPESSFLSASSRKELNHQG